MERSERKSGLFVVPGDRLGVIEEFVSGSGTYIEHGTIYSDTTGHALLDMLNKKVSVYPMAHVASVPRAGNTVIGQVSNVQSKMAALRIFKIGKTLLSGFFTGILHISDTSFGYIETMFEACKLGDIMRAKVIINKNRTYHLSTADNDLGVLYAFCSRCGHMLLQGRQAMKCPDCGKMEKRKVASDYGESLV